MLNIKEQVLREFGDQGADTLERYFVQINYTALLCINMIFKQQMISTIIPEGVEDVVVIRNNVYELHQVKTRDESQGPWTTAEVLPILCQQYHRRKAFVDSECCYHFISNQVADTKTKLQETPPAYGPLYRLKFLLEVKHDGQTLSAEEQRELSLFEKVLIPRIQEYLLNDHNDLVDYPTAVDLLYNTWIQTDCPMMRSTGYLGVLENALAELFPGALPYTWIQLDDIYKRILLLLLGKIMHSSRLAERRVLPQDVLNCRVAASYSGHPDAALDSAPGRCVLDKKAYLGGFDLTELPVFHKQKTLAEWGQRQLQILGMQENLSGLITAILDLQVTCRHRVCRKQNMVQSPGPEILEMLRPELPPLIKKYFPEVGIVDEQFCLGSLWQETDHCSAWWHGLNASGGSMQHGTSANK